MMGNDAMLLTDGPARTIGALRRGMIWTLAALAINGWAAAVEPPAASRSADSLPAVELSAAPLPPMIDWRMMARRLETELQLTGEQLTEVKQAISEHMRLSADLRIKMQPPKDLMEKASRLQQEMQTAQDAGDAARVRSLAKKLQDLRSEHSDRIAPLREQLARAPRELRERLLKILPAEERFSARRILDEEMAKVENRRNPRRLKAAIDKLPDLTEEQRKQIGRVFELLRNSSDSSPEARTQQQRLAVRLYEVLRSVLTPAQQELFDADLRLPARSADSVTASPTTQAAPAEAPTSRPAP